MVKPTWELFFRVLAGVIVFVVPMVLYLMDKGNKKMFWIFTVGLVSVGIAGLYLVLNIPWIWSPASLAWRIYRACVLSCLALMAVSAFGIWVWPVESQQRPPEAVPEVNAVPDLAFSFRQIASNETQAPLQGGGTTIIIIGDVLNRGKMPHKCKGLEPYDCSSR